MRNERNNDHATHTTHHIGYTLRCPSRDTAPAASGRFTAAGAFTCLGPVAAMNTRDEAVRYLDLAMQERWGGAVPDSTTAATIVVDELLANPDLMASLIMDAALRGKKSTGVLAWEEANR